GIELRSEQVQVSVGEARAELPAPTTRPPAVEDVLDPEQVVVELEIVIPPWPDMRDGQTVHLLWQGKPGHTHTDFLRINDSTAGREVVFYLDRATLDEYLHESIELSYRVESDDEATQYSAIARFSIGVGQGTLPLPVILEAQGNEVNPDDILQGATVQIAASAQLKDYDVVTIHVISAVTGGSTDIDHPINAGEGGQEVRVSVPWAVIDASAGTTFQLKYTITRAAGGPADESGTVTYSVVSDIGDGPLQIMGARSTPSVWRSNARQKRISALHANTLVPVLAEWRYEGDQQWTKATSWVDDKSWLKLYVRSGSETWECREANVFGNGAGVSAINGNAAFVAMRDEIVGEGGIKADMVAWGNEKFGGVLDDRLSAIDTVVEISATAYAYAARLRDGSMVCWGYPEYGGTPATLAGEFIEVKGAIHGFAGRKRDGTLHVWGGSYIAPIPEHVHRHKDYKELTCSDQAVAALRENGQAVAWGNPNSGGQMRPGQELFNDIVTIASTTSAFAALRQSGNSSSVIAWGAANWGGEVPGDIASRTDVKRIPAATANTFCILLETGAVKTWPATGYGGHIPKVIADLTNIVDVTSTVFAFCARLNNGKVVAWGTSYWGGDLTPEVEARSDIVQVTGNVYAFAALCSDGSVVAWGDQLSGGDTSAVADKLVNVQAIYGNTHGFTALTKDGRVVTWGVGPGGGNSDHVQPELTGKVTHSRLLSPAHAEAIATTTHRYGEQP
ncbi:MAG TPA: hypothetical protein DIT18_03110, partial [Pseudomonas sp.]|nr:hypothetical protein [Pseudomonas sp.]